MQFKYHFIQLLILFILALYNPSKAQNPDVLVTDLRLKLLSPENSRLDADLFIGIMEDAAFMKSLHDSISDQITNTIHANSVNFHVNCFQYMLGLTNKPLQYKKIDTDGADIIVFFESTLGMTEISKEEEYSVVTSIKVMNYKKKKLFKGVESHIIDHLKDGLPEISQIEFRNAYVRSLSKAVSIITLQ